MKRYITIPTRASTGVNELGLRSLIQTLSLLIPPSESTQLVTVVPTFAPIMTFIACLSVIRPEFTKPTTITVVADEL